MKDIIFTNSKVFFRENNMFIIYFFWDIYLLIILNVLLTFNFYCLFLFGYHFFNFIF